MIFNSERVDAYKFSTAKTNFFFLSIKKLISHAANIGKKVTQK